MGVLGDIKEGVKRNAIPVIGGSVLICGYLYVAGSREKTSVGVPAGGSSGTTSTTSAVVSSRGIPILRQLAPAFKALWSRAASILPQLAPSDSK